MKSSILRHILLDFDGDNFNGGLSRKLRPDKLGATGEYQEHRCPQRLSLLNIGMLRRLPAGFGKKRLTAVVIVIMSAQSS